MAAQTARITCFTGTKVQILTHIYIYMQAVLQHACAALEHHHEDERAAWQHERAKDAELYAVA